MPDTVSVAIAPEIIIYADVHLDLKLNINQEKLHYLSVHEKNVFQLLSPNSRDFLNVWPSGERRMCFSMDTPERLDNDGLKRYI